MSKDKMAEYGRQPSKIRDLFEYGLKRKREIGNDKVFDFSLGNPSVLPNKRIIKGFIDTLNNNKNPFGYTSASGDFNLRKNISNQINTYNNDNISYEDIFVTCGAAAALTITLNSLIESQDDEIIIFSPFFPEYEVFIEEANAKTVKCELNQTDFQIDFQNLEKCINKNTKAVIINSPNNPTGTVLSSDTISKLSHLLKKYSDKYNQPIYIISDEPYRELIYDDTKYVYVPLFYDNCIICYSYSKSMSMPGLRIGYIQTNPRISNKEEIYYAIRGSARALGYVCAPSLPQYVISENVDAFSDINQYKKNRDLLYNELTKLGYEVVKPQGAFYMFVKSPSKSGTEMSQRAKKYNLLLVPSESFGIDGYIRISYCVEEDLIKKSFKSFEELINSYRGE